MLLDVLGSSGTYSTPDRPASGYLVTEGATKILCDAGFGTFGELMRRTTPDQLDAVVLSHRHPDHCVDFLALHHAIAHGPYSCSGLPVFCAPGVANRLADFIGAGEGHQFFEIFDFHEVGDNNHVVVGDVDLRFAAGDHSVPTIATRFECAGRSITYSADTGPGGGFPELCAGTTVVLAEASLPGDRADNHYAHHLTAGEAGSIARAAGAEALILTHLRPSLDHEQSIKEARSMFDGRVVIAEPNTVYEI